MTGTYPQPHEGITGVVRDQDDLLGLDDKALARRALIIGLARCLHRATLVGNPAPIVARMHERIQAPRPGDLVLETSTMYRLGDDGHKAFGILLAHRVEWWSTDEEHAAMLAEERGHDPDYVDDERLTDHAWYVQYGPEPGDICRWTNCSFAVIPTGHAEFDVQVGTRDGTGVTYTRTDVLAGLADSGFSLRDPRTTA